MPDPASRTARDWTRDTRQDRRPRPDTRPGRSAIQPIVTRLRVAAVFRPTPAFRADASMYFRLTGERSCGSTRASMSAKLRARSASASAVAELGDGVDARSPHRPSRAPSSAYGQFGIVEQILALGDRAEDAPAAVVHQHDDRAETVARRLRDLGARSSGTPRRRTGRSDACRCRSARRARPGTPKPIDA